MLYENLINNINMIKKNIINDIDTKNRSNKYGKLVFDFNKASKIAILFNMENDNFIEKLYKIYLANFISDIIDNVYVFYKNEENLEKYFRPNVQLVNVKEEIYKVKFNDFLAETKKIKLNAFLDNYKDNVLDNIYYIYLECLLLKYNIDILYLSSNEKKYMQGNYQNIIYSNPNIQLKISEYKDINYITLISLSDNEIYHLFNILSIVSNDKQDQIIAGEYKKNPFELKKQLIIAILLMNNIEIDDIRNDISKFERIKNKDKLYNSDYEIINYTKGEKYYNVLSKMKIMSNRELKSLFESGAIKFYYNPKIKITRDDLIIDNSFIKVGKKRIFLFKEV